MRRRCLAVRWCVLCSTVVAEPHGVENIPVASTANGAYAENTDGTLAHWRRVGDNADQRDMASCSLLKVHDISACEPTEFSLYGSSNALAACCKRTTHLERGLTEMSSKALSKLPPDELDEKLEDRPPNHIDLTVAVMLIGSVTLVMSLFYLVNHHDADIKEYSWQMISATIAIFVSVLMFQGFNGVLLHASNQFMESQREALVMFPVLVNYAQFIIWFATLQLTIAYICLEDELGKEAHAKVIEHQEQHRHSHGGHTGSRTSGFETLSGASHSTHALGTGSRRHSQKGASPGAVQWNSAPAVYVKSAADAESEKSEPKTTDDLVKMIIQQDPQASTSYLRVHRTPKQMEAHHAHKILMMKCWAILLAHTTGFAAIHAGGELQHMTFFKNSPMASSLAVVLQCPLFILICGMSDTIRSKIESYQLLRHAAHIWDEETEEAENDFCAIALSFLLVQSVRHRFGGLLPSVSGLLYAGSAHGSQYVIGVFACSGVFAVLSVCLILVRPPAMAMIARLLRIIQATCAMGFAWCMFFASRTTIADACLAMWGDKFHFHAPGVSFQVIVACALSMGAVGIIFLLDSIEDLDATGDVSDKAIKSIISSLGILVGFSWEQAFDGGVEVISELTRYKGSWYPVFAKFAMGTLLAGGFIPAWRRHILKNSFHNKKMLIARRERREKTRRERKLKHVSADAFAAFGLPQRLTGGYSLVPTSSD